MLNQIFFVISGFYKPSTLKGNHTSYIMPVTFSV
jgi:hypothetical protein